MGWPHTSPVDISSGTPYESPRCPTRHHPRIEEAVTRRLVEKSADAEVLNDELVLTLPNGQHRLSRAAARALRDELTAALTGREEYLRTAGEHRADGSYVVSRRTADSAGHAKQFRDFRSLEALYERLPDRFDADDVGDAARSDAAGPSSVTGNRRHLVLRHFAEHPAFDCELVSRQPLTVRKEEETDERPEIVHPGTVDPEVAPMD